jgi:hypothetical protein
VLVATNRSAGTIPSVNLTNGHTRTKVYRAQPLPTNRFSSHAVLRQQPVSHNLTSVCLPPSAADVIAPSLHLSCDTATHVRSYRSGVPFTFFAHQAVVLPLKLKRPGWFDATALCVGSMAPDLAYPLGPWLGSRSHTFAGLAVWSIPFTVVASMIVRVHVASVAFAHAPDMGRFRLHSFRSLRTRRPSRLVTVVSAALGSGSHVLIDGFTHTGRFGSRLLGWDRTLFNAPIVGAMSIARVFQYIGHTLGSVMGLSLLALVGRKRLIEAWYGADEVRAARSFALRMRARVVFWSIIASGPPLGVLWARTSGGTVAFEMIDATALTAVVASLVPACRPMHKERFLRID